PVPGGVGDLLGVLVPVGLAQAEPVHRAAFGSVAIHVREGPFGIAVLERVEPALLAPAEQLEDPLGGMPGGERLAEVLVGLGVGVDGIAADDHAWDLVPPEPDRW